MSARDVSGHRLSGAVASTAMTVCRCDICRHHTGSMFRGRSPAQTTLKIARPAKSFCSSEWAERGFGSACGTTLWYAKVHDGERYMAAGLFKNAAGDRPSIEYFSERRPESYALVGNHRRKTEEETTAVFAEGGAP